MDILFDIFKILGCIAGSLLLIVLIIAIIVAPFKARADKKKTKENADKFIENVILPYLKQLKEEAKNQEEKATKKPRKTKKTEEN